MVYLPVVRRRILTAPIEKPHFISKHCHYAKDLVGIGFERQLSLKRVLGAFDAQKRVHEIYVMSV